MPQCCSNSHSRPRPYPPMEWTCGEPSDLERPRPTAADRVDLLRIDHDRKNEHRETPLQLRVEPRRGRSSRLEKCSGSGCGIMCEQFSRLGSRSIKPSLRRGAAACLPAILPSSRIKRWSRAEEAARRPLLRGHCKIITSSPSRALLSVAATGRDVKLCPASWISKQQRLITRAGILVPITTYLSCFPCVIKSLK